jgi:hypothetical protein
MKLSPAPVLKALEGELIKQDATADILKFVIFDGELDEFVALDLTANFDDVVMTFRTRPNATAPEYTTLKLGEGLSIVEDQNLVIEYGTDFFRRDTPRELWFDIRFKYRELDMFAHLVKPSKMIINDVTTY